MYNGPRTWRGTGAAGGAGGLHDGSDRQVRARPDFPSRYFLRRLSLTDKPFVAGYWFIAAEAKLRGLEEAVDG